MAKKAAKKAAKKKAPKRKAAKRKAPKRQPARRPGRKPARRPGTSPATGPATATQAEVTITLGCNGNNCGPDQDPIHMSPGDTVVLRAPSNDVKVHFTG